MSKKCVLVVGFLFCFLCVPFVLAHNEDILIAILLKQQEQLNKILENTSQVIFTEDFESYEVGSLLGGNGKWNVFPGFANLKVVQGNILGTKVPAYEIPSNGDRQCYSVVSYFPQPLGLAKVYKLTCDAYLYSGTHNSYIGFGADNTKLIIWNSVSNSYGLNWYFGRNDINDDYNRIVGGLEKKVRLSVVLDPARQKYYGIYDFGNGPQKTREALLPMTMFQNINRIVLSQDFRAHIRGAEFDNIQITALTRLDADNLENQIRILDMLRKEQIPMANLKLWLKPEGVHVKDEALLVDRWDDASGHGNHVATQGNKCPKYIPFSQINNRPAVRFVRSSNSYQELRCPAKEDFNFTEATIFVVSTPNTNQGSILSILAEGSREHNGVSFSYGNPVIYHYDPAGKYSLLNHPSPTQPYILSAILGKADDDLVLYVNGGSRQMGRGSGSIPNTQDFSPTPRHVVVGNEGSVVSGESLQVMENLMKNRTFEGDIAEVLVYSGKLSDDERAIVERYLSMKYGIPLN